MKDIDYKIQVMLLIGLFLWSVLALLAELTR
jgi:hypothetical protein